MQTYKLINPAIIGDMNTSYSAKTPLDAAQKAWKTMSQHITNNVPQFGFSLIDNSSDKLHHFVVSESVSQRKVKCNISEIDSKINTMQESSLILNESKMNEIMNYVNHGENPRKQMGMKIQTSMMKKNQNNWEEDIIVIEAVNMMIQVIVQVRILIMMIMFIEN